MIRFSLNLTGSNNAPSILPERLKGWVRSGLSVIVWWCLSIIIIAGLLLLFGYHYLTQDLPSVESLEHYNPPTVTYFYSSDGRVIGEFFNEYRIVAPLNVIPDHLIKAVIAAEDSNFYNHPGYDLSGIVRALFMNIEAGRVVQGASTITQQLTRSFFLTNEKSIRRKLKEMILATRIDKNLTKEQILHLYLNQIYFGQGAYGAQAASLKYFNKNVSELSLSESVLLAGVIPAPSYFSPLSHPEKNRDRRKYVLRQMVNVGFISEDQALEVMDEPLELSSHNFVNFKTVPYFTEHVRRMVESIYGYQGIYRDGLKVYTTVDIDVQQMAQRSLRQGLRELEGRRGLKKTYADNVGEAGLETSLTAQGALVLLNNSSGEVMAMVGGRDFSDSQFNRAYQARRQPGSAFKPIIYAAAMEKGYTPGQIIMDEPVFYEDRGRLWQPRNYDRRNYGPTTLYQGLVQSRNVVAVRLLEIVGIKPVRELAKSMGIHSPLAPYLSLALGSSEVSLLELTSAYSCFPNQGERIEPVFIRKIEDRQGKVLLDVKPQRERVMDPISSYLVLDMMRGVVSQGTGRRVAALNRPVAGKTGTTDDLADAWFIGFTPSYTAGVWVGEDRRHSLGPGENGGRTAGPIFLYFMREFLKNSPPEDFSIPEGVFFMDIDPETGLPADDLTTQPLKVCLREDLLNQNLWSSGKNNVKPQPTTEHIRLIFREGKVYKIVGKLSEESVSDLPNPFLPALPGPDPVPSGSADDVNDMTQ